MRNDSQAPIRLARRDYGTGGYHGRISGWGKTTMDSGASPILKWVDTKVLSRSECSQTYHLNMIPQQICTMEKVACNVSVLPYFTADISENDCVHAHVSLLAMRNEPIR